MDDGLGEIVQVLHTLGHVNGDDELGLQVDEPVHRHIIKAAAGSMVPANHNGRFTQINREVYKDATRSHT